MTVKKLTFYDPDALRTYRLRLGLNQEGLARKSGVTRAQIANIESGRRRLSANDALPLWMSLASIAIEVERPVSSLAALKAPELPAPSECAVLGLQAAAALEKVAHREIAEAQRMIESGNRKLKGAQAWLTQIKSEKQRLTLLKYHSIDTHVIAGEDKMFGRGAKKDI